MRDNELEYYKNLDISDAKEIKHPMITELKSVMQWHRRKRLMLMLSNGLILKIKKQNDISTK